MTKTQFLALCGAACIAPDVALESPAIRALLLERAPVEKVKAALETEF